jgi:hypothetical protein
LLHNLPQKSPQAILSFLKIWKERHYFLHVGQSIVILLIVPLKRKNRT